MQAFGIELRKTGASNILKDVDIILRTNGMQSGEISKEFQVMSIKHALHKMMKSDSYFDICTINNCIRICDINISQERIDCYRAVHCIHWREMEVSYKTLLVAMIIDDFRDILN